MNLKDIPPQPLGKFAVMRHSKEAKRAHFSVLHETYAEATAEAIRLVSKSAQEMPERQHFYYVLEVKARFDAGPDGLQSLES